MTGLPQVQVTNTRYSPVHEMVSPGSSLSSSEESYEAPAPVQPVSKKGKKKAIAKSAKPTGNEVAGAVKRVTRNR